MGCPVRGARSGRFSGLLSGRKHVAWRWWMLYRAGVPIKVIQARLGHSRWQTTADWYIESDTEGEREAANVASRLLEVGK
jgi:hypothetical protein